MYIDETTLRYPLQENEIRKQHPERLFTSPFNPPDRYKRVTQTPMPDYDPISQTVVEGAPEHNGEQWVRTWIVLDLTQEQSETNRKEVIAETINLYLTAMEELYDAKARERKYDNRITCALRAGYPGPFHDEGVAFAAWMDACNAYAYQVLDEVASGTRELPTVDGLLSELPILNWPN